MGFYTLTITKEGFEVQKLQKVEVAVGKVTNQTITLGLAQTRETFAFTPSCDSKLVIRGHYGVYYDIINGNLFVDNRAGSDAVSTAHAHSPIALITSCRSWLGAWAWAFI